VLLDFRFSNLPRLCFLDNEAERCYTLDLEQPAAEE